MKNFSRIITRAFLLGLLILAGQPAFAQQVIRKTSLVRGKDYYQHVFYQGKKEVARYKENTTGAYDQEGFLPDGPVQFVDKAHNTYGEEHYRYGLRNGLSRTYFPDGKLKKEEYYEGDVLVWEKEYYRDGQLRLSANYSEALDCGTKNEAGEGKIYFKEGGLKYEWSFTLKNTRNYQKAYIKSGPLRYEAYFNEKCEKTEERRVADPEATSIAPGPSTEAGE